MVIKHTQEVTCIFPIHLFKHNPGLQVDRVVYLVEEPRYFKDFKFHKQKLMLHRASMQEYALLLRKDGYNVQYISVNKADELFLTLHQNKVSKIHYVDPVDNVLSKRLKDECKKYAIQTQMYESPAFLSSEAWLREFFGPSKKYHMASFYQSQRKRLGILVHAGKPVGGAWSFDTENRKRLPDNINIPSLSHSHETTVIKEARKYVAENFSDNPGDTNVFIYPVTHEQAERWLEQFFHKRFQLFGPYEDSIDQNEVFLFHSQLSPLLNIGLLTPAYVIEEALAFASKYHICINSLEGFIRQIIGWREFVRAIYVLEGPTYSNHNYFRHNRSIPKTWWKGTTGIIPVDSSIRKVIKYGYVHHIERLMILGNMMLLSEFDPQEVYRWFMELFIDAYDWVMAANVLGMSQYADGGLITTKPYISGANYILKMSNYKKGDWADLWTALYWVFLNKHKNILAQNPRMNIALKSLRAMRPEVLKDHMAIAKKYLNAKSD
jgi:deoxyribodipyrimidine photolyase-related protein